MQAAVISYAKKECAPIDGQKCETFTALAQDSKDEKHVDKKKDEDKEDNKKEEKKDVTPKKHDDDQDKEEKDDKKSGGGGKKKTQGESEESDIYDSLPKGDLSKEAKALREMIIELLKLIEEVDKK